MRRKAECSLAARVDECKAALRIMLFLQRNRIHGDKNLEGRGHNRLDHVSPAGVTVTMSYHHMRMERRLALIQREVPNHRQDLDLLVDRDLPVHFLLQIKPRQGRSAQRSNGSKVTTR